MMKPKQKQSLLPLMQLTLLLLLIAFYTVKAVPGQRSTIQACGSALTETAFAVCRGRFNDIRSMKRSSMDLFDFGEQRNEMQADEPTPWDQPLRSYNLMMTTRRGKRGIVDECCYKACTFYEMDKYCSA